jgi:hypothetical protein
MPAIGRTGEGCLRHKCTDHEAEKCLVCSRTYLKSRGCEGRAQGESSIRKEQKDGCRQYREDTDDSQRKLEFVIKETEIH